MRAPAALTADPLPPSKDPLSTTTDPSWGDEVRVVDLGQSSCRLTDLIGSFSRIEADLHAQYRLAYIPRKTEKEGEWREVEVSVRGRRNLTTRTRNGYYAIPSGE